MEALITALNTCCREACVSIDGPGAAARPKKKLPRQSSLRFPECRTAGFLRRTQEKRAHRCSCKP